MQYQYQRYSFQDTPKQLAAQEQIDQMVADGWTVHTALPNFTELAMLWHKPDDVAPAAHCPGCSCPQAAEDPVPEV
jgi:hypothetical protein